MPADKPAEKKTRAKAPAKRAAKPVAKTAADDAAVAKPVAADAAVAVAKPKAAKSKAPKSAATEPAVAKPKAASSKRTGGTLVIVESPAKASTIKKYLGAGFEVKASVGHVKDLPKATIGIDIEHDFTPEYVVIDAKKKVIAEIKSAAKRAAQVLLAPDPDREGEAIAWHIADEIRPSNPNIQRVLFNEITKKAVLEAIQHPRELDLKKYESQQARRVLDRLVGYQISPVLWVKVRRGLSAGRVQSVAVRLLVEREEEIKAFQSVEYWTVEVDLEGKNPPPLVARLVAVDGKKPELVHEGQAQEALALIRQASLRVLSVDRKERKKNPPPPFITSRLQQEASSKLRFSPKRTMALAQRLYEGIDLGAEGSAGLITYMRTDSTRISDEAIKDVREQIVSRFSAAHLPAEPNIFKSKKSAQDAHEAIRPTLIDHDPERVRALLTESGAGRDARETQDLIKLYTLIWNRFMASQMTPAVFDQTTIEIDAGRATLRATGQVMRFAGFLEVYAETQEDAPDEDQGGNLPVLQEGEILRLLGERPEQHFTQPPPRYSEATLVRELEEKGIGRPSTYAAILSTIQDRGYAEKREGRLAPTELGVVVNGLLVKSFPDILNTDFTAQMEERLDEVEEGAADWIKLLRDFYLPFEKDLNRAKVEMRDLKREEQPTEEVCEKCGKPMIIKWGRNGYFLACSGYPDCRNTKEYTRNSDGTLTVLPSTRPSDQTCPTCSSPMVVRRGRFGEFLACSRYPDCKTTSPISLGVMCPRPNCGGYLSEKRSRRGKVFFGCSHYAKSKCDFVSWDRPIPKPCPTCGAPFVVQKVLRSGTRLRCIAEGCGWAAESEEAEPEVQAS